ncbi:unnamed protein product [Nezara viridula]|uniref:Uncharacterized protein n=1 Tax=Nezara viridula TaxID=85310 RepID=A0A9P0HS79_NEZVI|nr:unnamed protein product [Nezara viridula]
MSFPEVEKSKYFGSTITSMNERHVEIDQRIASLRLESIKPLSYLHLYGCET